MNATLPDGWDTCSLKHCKAFGRDFDVTMNRSSDGKVTVEIFDRISGSSRTYKPDRNGTVAVKF